MLYLLIFTLGSFAPIACSSPLQAVRDDRSLGQFYAYGTNISGIPLFYADGKAYIGLEPPRGATIYTNVTLTETDDNYLEAAPTNETLSGNWTTPRLYIDTTEGTSETVGFTPSTTSNTSFTTTGFSTFGSLLVWTDNVGAIQSNWYAQQIDIDLWALLWNVDNTPSSNAVVVVLKNHAPSK